MTIAPHCRRSCLPSPGLVLGALLLVPSLAFAAGPVPIAPGSAVEPGWIDDALEQLRDPWFFFGMTAQMVFFARFVVQWIVSEKRRRSTVPISFWYLSLVGSMALFVYAFHRRDLVIMAGQALACFIYVRNLMLISDWQKRRRQAGLPDAETETDTNGATGSVASDRSAP